MAASRYRLRRDELAQAVDVAMHLVPQTLVQPILPGWTLNVNAFNSSAPQTEAEIVQRHSYGRQLGRIAEALAALLDDRDPDKADRASGTSAT